MKDLESLSASQAAKALSKREIKATDLLLSCLDRIGQRESAVKAWVSLGKENALARAKQLDKGAIQGLLHGLPIGVKDLFDTYDLPTAYGSPIYQNNYAQMLFLLHSCVKLAASSSEKRSPQNLPPSKAASQLIPITANIPLADPLAAQQQQLQTLWCP